MLSIMNYFLLFRSNLQDVIDQLDVKVMLRVPHDVLVKRRYERHGYHTAGRKFLTRRLLGKV